VHPVFGLTAVTVGVNANLSFAETGLVPSGMLIPTSTRPAASSDLSRIGGWQARQ
jgi:hypothetical protein